MTTTLATPPTTPASVASTTTGLTHREQIAFMVFSTWMIAGLFLDGWSHNVRKPETFFTPWHALLYSGFQMAVIWSFWDGRQVRRRGEVSMGVDRLATVGIAMFAFGAVADFLWHTLLGIEVNVEGLLSPTHLTLMTGGILLASTPARMALRAGRDGGIARPPATYAVVQSIIATTAIVAFFTQFASAFRGRDIVQYVALRGMGHHAELNAVLGVAAILITNAVLVFAVTFLVSRYTVRPGALTALVGIVALAVSGLTSFHHVVVVLAALAAGFAGDVVVARGRSDLAPVVIPLVMWPAWAALLALTTPFGWSPNVWGGAIFFSVLTGVALRTLTQLEPSPRGA